MLERFELLKSLNEKQLNAIEKICEQRNYAQGEALFHEGEGGDEIYFLTSGTVGLYKREENTSNNLKFKEMFAGQSFGEMSFADGSPRSCSIAAESNDVQAYILSKQKLIDSLPDASLILNTLNATINNQVSDYLRYLSDQYIGSLQEKIDILQEQNKFGIFFVNLLAILFMSAFINSVVDDFFPNLDVYSTGFNWVIVISALIPAIVWMVKSKFDIRQMLWTRKKLKKSFLDGIIFSCIAVLVMFAGSYLIDNLVPNSNLNLVTKFLTWSLSFPRMVVYFASSYLQELLRAIVQTTVQQFLLDKSGYYSVFITALALGMVHMQYGTQAIVLVSIIAVVFGLIYSRTYNLIGVSIFHFVMGCIAINMQLL